MRKTSGIALNTMAKLRRDEEVILTVLEKICKVLKIDYGDIMEYVDKSANTRRRRNRFFEICGDIQENSGRRRVRFRESQAFVRRK